jgi:hypothetical protein
VDRLRFVFLVAGYWLVIAPVTAAVLMLRSSWSSRRRSLLIAAASAAVFSFLVAGIHIVIPNSVNADLAFVRKGPPRLAKCGPNCFEEVRDTAPDYEYLRTGARCAVKQEVFPRQSVQICLADDGVTRVTREGKAGWETQCCTEIEVGSDKTLLSAVRRFEASSPWLSLLSFILLPFGIGTFILATVAWTIFLTATWVAIMAPILAFLFSALRGTRNIWLCLRVPRLHAWQFATELDGSPIIGQISDLHLTKESSLPEEIRALPELWMHKDHELNGNVIAARVSTLLEQLHKYRPMAIAMTGDLTDTGDAVEWKGLREVIRSHREQQQLPPLFLIPGNHDLSFNPPDRPDISLQGRLTRESLFASSIAEIGVIGEPLVSDNLLPSYKKLGPVHVIMLDSNRYPSRHSFSGGLGFFGMKQLQSVSHKLETIEGNVIVLMHHHVAVPKSRSFASLGTFAIDASHLLTLLRKFSERLPLNKVLISHGHKHREIRAVDQSGRVHVYGHPSSTLGALRVGSDGISRLDGICRFALIGITSSGNWTIQTHDFYQAWSSTDAQA